MTVSNEIEDLLNVISYVSALPTTKNISLVGHSQGGVVSGMVAGICGALKIKSLFLLSAAAVLRDDALRGITMGSSFDPWHLDKPFYLLPTGEKLGRAYIQDAIALPIYEKTENYVGPVFIAHGMADQTVPYTYAERYQKCLPQADNGSLFPNHLPILISAIRLSDGYWLEVKQPFEVDPRDMIWTERFFAFAEGAAIIFIMAWLLLRVTKRLRQWSKAVENFGRHPENPERLPMRGPAEIREAAASFNRMSEMIRGNMAERDRMIAAMGHDLRTPLTRLRLQIDKVALRGLRDQLHRTASDILAIVSQSLALARSLDTSEPMIKMDLCSFLQSMADDYADMGHNVSFSFPEGGPYIIKCRPVCLKRCLENLISNACQYGGDVEVSFFGGSGDDFEIHVRDHGPGIPDDMLERVFEPYARLEGSRNRAYGGTGLGLAIARNMAFLNNCDILLSNHHGGGLLARVIFR